MENNTEKGRAIELLQQLGLKEYEAKCFVALSRVPEGTAKEVSEISEVPRTRVYDAVKVLETKGLVEIQHSNPQKFRSVSIDEAIGVLRTEYETRTEQLRETLANVEPASTEQECEETYEVWTLKNSEGIDARTAQLIDGAEEELIVVFGPDATVSSELLERLESALDRGVSLFVGTSSNAIHDQLTTVLPDDVVFISNLSLLDGTALAGDEVDVCRLVLADRKDVLVSTYHPDKDGGEVRQAVTGNGFDNGVVTVIRRTLLSGCEPVAPLEQE